MPRTVRKTNIRVTVYPRSPWNFGNRTPESIERAELDQAEQILADIRRHVDNYGQAMLTYDLVTYCSTYEWEEDSEGNALDKWPNCCSDDQYEFYAKHAAESDEWFAEHGMNDPEYLAEFRAGLHRPEEED